MYCKFENYHIYYETKGYGYPIIFLHGLGGNRKQVEDIGFDNPKCMLVLIDLPGHGLSGTPKDYSFKNMAEAVIAVADDLRLNSFMIGGISMGAAVALNVALTYPERVEKLFLIRSAWINEPLDNRFIQLYRRLGDYLSKNDLDNFLRVEPYEEIKKECPGLADSMLHAFTDTSSLMVPDKYRKIPKLIPFNDLNELLKIQVRTLVLWCDNDPLHTKKVADIYSEKILLSKTYQLTSPYTNRYKYNKEISKYISEFI